MFLKNNAVAGVLIILGLSLITVRNCFSQVKDKAGHALTQAQQDAFREEAVKSINDLEKYMQVIANKKNPLDTKNDAIELALNLFISDTTTIEISSLSSKKPRTYTIATYLARLKLLPYASVKITFYRIYLGSQFVKGPNGYYYGTASFEQKFEGITNNELGHYSDITTRRITIILKKLDVHHGDGGTDSYVLKLGDIRVEDTIHG